MKSFNPIVHLLIGALFAWGSASLGAVEGPQASGEQAGATLPTNAEASTAYLHLQEQIHETHLALERNRLEAEAAAARNAEMLASHLQTIEQSLAAQRTRELEEIQRSNRLMLTLTGAFAGVGLLALFGMAYFQWHTVSRLAALPGMSPALPALGPNRAFARLGAGDLLYGAMDSVEQTNRRWSNVLAQLEQRIGELEQTTRLPLKDAARNPQQSNGRDSSAGSFPPAGNAGNHTAEGDRVSALLGKGQLLMNLGRPADALPVFDEVLALEPGNAEAQVKRGTALEQLGRLDEAIQCFDRAIAADGSMTMAYLCKGGLFNRMQRFQEALECYERALHAHAKPAV